MISFEKGVVFFIREMNSKCLLFRQIPPLPEYSGRDPLCQGGISPLDKEG